MLLTTTKTAEEILEDLASELELPEGRYEAAERSYRSVGDWLERPGSLLRPFSPQIYPQGSFRLGTATKPANGEEHYDLDVVCELRLGKDRITQAQLKEMLGKEVEAYAERYSMAEPGESRRCWTLEYADGAQFHMDLLPAVPDGARQRLLLEARSLDATWAETAIAITDRDHPNFEVTSGDWPSSNPKAYSAWFVDRMRVVLEARKSALAGEIHERAEDIPDYKVKTPLQQAVQILKRHRDVTFADRPDERPISIILTTLAAKSYRQEARLSEALFSILAGMDRHIEVRQEIREGRARPVHWVANPTDPRENFADRWEEFPERRDAFYEWLRTAREDFATAAREHDPRRVVEALAPRLGRPLVEGAARRRHPVPSTALSALSGVGTRIAARSYKEQLLYHDHESEFELLRAVVGGMPEFIDERPDRGGRRWVIRNESTIGENFAEKWNSDPERAEAFFSWHGRVVSDLDRLAARAGLDVVRKSLAASFGEGPADGALRSWGEEIGAARRMGTLGVSPAAGLTTAAVAADRRPTPVRANTFFGAP